MDTTDLSPYPAVTLFHTHRRTLASARVGIDYAVSVWLPESYATGQKSYPVVYLLDGNFMFGLATDETHILMEGNEVPDLMIVGIGYDIASYADWITHRNRDYTPIPNPDQPGEGGAPRFLEFVETELIPFIDSNYRTNPTDRTLFGYSLGGSFVLYALLKQPALFQRYVAGAPYLGFGDRVMFQYETQLARSRSSLPVKLAIFVGELDDFRPIVEAFSTLLRNRNYEGLELKTFVLDGETHFSGPASTYIRGLKALFG